MQKFFITSDVHSFYDELKMALSKKGFQDDNPDHILVVLGDLFDRGNKSVEVYNFCKNLGDRFIYITGNHEYLLYQCVQEMISDMEINTAHYSNGTVKTISHFCGIPYEKMTTWNFMWRRTDSEKELVYNSMRPILDWISSKSIPYYEVGDSIFVHGWIPLQEVYYTIGGKLKYEVVPQDKWEDSDWEGASWLNGIEMWHQGYTIPEKTIWAGHYHTSYYWSRIKQKRKEFPDKSRKDWQKSFEVVKESGAVFMDSCCGYSGFLNCITLEIEDEE